MNKGSEQRWLRLAIQCAIFLALMVGVLLRLRHENAPWYQIVGRPLVVMLFGYLVVSGRSWGKWGVVALSLAYAWWYAKAATVVTLPPEFRGFSAIAAALELGCAAVMLTLRWPAVSSPRREAGPG